MQGRTLCNFAVLLFSLFLLNCGGGDGVAGVGGSKDDKIPDPPFPSYNITGIAFIGAVNKSRINLYSYDGRSLITSTITDSLGNFTLTTNNKIENLLVCMSGGEYTESFSGSVIQLSDTDELCSAFSNIPGKDSKILINFYSHLAYGLSKYLLFSKDESPIDNANAIISGWVGFNIIRTEHKDVTEISGDVILSESLRVGFANAAVSVVADQISKLNGRPPGKEDTSIKFAIAVHNDIAHDGLFNGQGADGAVMIGGLTMKSSYIRHDIAFGILILGNSAQNGTSITSSQLVESSTLINDSLLSMFGNDPVVSFIIDRPVIQSASVKPDDVLSGITTLNVVIDDLIGLTQVGLSVKNDDPTLLAGTGVNNFKFNDDFTNPSFEFDTTGLTDGIGYYILISAKNILNNNAIVIRIANISISNNGASINSITPPDSPNNPTLIRGILKLRAVVLDVVGLQYVSLSINGGQAIAPDTVDYENPRFTVDTTQIKPDGLHVFKITAINKGGISTTRNVTYLIDNTPPLTGFVNYPDPGKTLYWNIGTYPVTAFSSDENGLSSTKLSLMNVNTMLLAGNLPNNRISLNFVVSSTTPEGIGSLVIESIDKAGGIANDPRKVIIDYSPPTISLHRIQVEKPYLSWRGGSLIGNWVGGGYGPNGERIYLNFNGVIEDLSGGDYFQVSIDGKNIGETLPVQSTATGDRFERWIQPADYAEGVHTLKVTVTDKSGNVNSATHVPLRFDNTNPSITISGQSMSYRKPETCAVEVLTYDNGGSGINKIILADSTYPAASGGWFAVLPSVLDGYNGTFVYEIVDNAGNSERKRMKLVSTCYPDGVCICELSQPGGVGWARPF